MRRLVILLVLLFCGGLAFAQRPIGKPGNTGPGSIGMPTNRNTRTNSTSQQNQNQNPDTPADSTEDNLTQKGIEHHEDIPDSVLIQSIYMFHYSPLAVKILDIQQLSFNPSNAQYADPIDAINGNYYLNKGIAGQSNQPIFYTQDETFGPQLRPITNYCYRKTPGSVKFYQVHKPFTLLGFAGSLKKDNHVYLTHSQNINERWNFAFDYHLIRSEGVYANSGVKNHYLDFTTNYYSRDSRYQLQGGIIWQKEALSENGGITDDDYVRNKPDATRSGIPVNLTSGSSLSKGTTYFVHQSYNTVQQVYKLIEHDSLAINIVDSTKFDTIKIYDTILPNAPKIINTGVFGLNLQWNTETRKFIDSTRWNQLSSSVFWTNDAYPDYIWHNPLKVTIGFSDLRILDFISSWNWYHYFGPTGQLEYYSRIGTILAHAQMLGQYGNRYLLNYRIPLDSLNKNALMFEVCHQTRLVDFLYQNLAETNNLPALQPEATTKFQASFIHNDSLNIDLIANQISNFVVLRQEDGNIMPFQSSGQSWLYQARLIYRKHWGWFHLDMQQMLQYSTDEEFLKVPVWASKNSLYADLELFSKALRAQIGFDVRYHTVFYANSYDPTLGVFYQQDEIPIGNYIMADAFINLQVKHASIYFKAGHLNSLIESHPNYFLLPHYPANRLGLFFGINWNFFD